MTRLQRTIIAAAAGTLAIAGTAAAAAPIVPIAAQAPLGGGTVSIAPRTADGAYDPAMAIVVAAVADALAAKGFTILEDADHSALQVELILSRVAVGTATAKIPTGKAEAAPGGAYGSVGAGVTIPLSTGQSAIVPLQRTRLELRLRRRGADTVLWEGAAVTVRAAGTRRGADAPVARDLAQGLMASYPAQPADVVGIP